MAESVCITDLTDIRTRKLFADLGEPSYRVKQLHYWVYQRLALSFDEMTDLPQPLCQRLTRETLLHSLTQVHETTGYAGTVKTLFALADGKTIESTLMPYRTAKHGFRYTVCLSTQVGCPIGCPFCATGNQGYDRNLSAGEIIDQVLYYARWLQEYDALWLAIERLNSPQCFGLGARNMVISTAGLVPQIKRLSQEKLQVGLAISLHASDNALRNRLVPINKRYPLEELIPACQEYFDRTGRRPSFEYVLFEGINDSIGHARSLARLLAGLNCHVNLLPANCAVDRSFRPSAKGTILAFQKELKRWHITCTLRQGRGLDIDAGCGQLRSRFAISGKG